MARTVKYEFFPFEEIEDIPDSKKSAALNQIGEYIHESILSYVGDQKSPVQGYGAFPKLNPDYKKYKASEGGSPIPNLELSGAMLSALKVKKSGESITISISGKQGDKADGHNNHSGDSTLPLRRFIPDEGETFKKDILNGVREILRSYK